MALFGLKGFKKKEEHVVDTRAESRRAQSTDKKSVRDGKKNTSGVKNKKTISAPKVTEPVLANVASLLIKHPRVTEKASMTAEHQNAYVFDVMPSVNKQKIAEAVHALYGVKPIKVHTLAIPRKTRLVRGRLGVTGGGKKAVVYLKKGDKIETN